MKSGASANNVFGTSIHFIDSDTNTRVGGTGVGGGTIIGLSSLLTGINEYSNIVSLAKQCQRKVEQ